MWGYMSSCIKKIYTEDIKKAIEINGFKISDRDKNKQFMRQFRLNSSKIKEILLDLDYSSLEKVDKDRNENTYAEGPIIIFMVEKELINFHGENKIVKIYIKIKLVKNQIIPIISFHEAEY